MRPAHFAFGFLLGDQGAFFSFPGGGGVFAQFVDSQIEVANGAGQLVGRVAQALDGIGEVLVGLLELNPFLGNGFDGLPFLVPFGEGQHLLTIFFLKGGLEGVGFVRFVGMGVPPSICILNGRGELFRGLFGIVFSGGHQGAELRLNVLGFAFGQIKFFQDELVVIRHVSHAGPDLFHTAGDFFLRVGEFIPGGEVNEVQQQEIADDEQQCLVHVGLSPVAVRRLGRIRIGLRGLVVRGIGGRGKSSRSPRKGCQKCWRRRRRTP